MNTNNSKSSKDPRQASQKPSEKQAKEPSPLTTPPLSSPNEPTRAYPADSSRNFSSDPSQYAYSQKNSSNEPSKVYTTEPLDTARISGDEKKSSINFSQKEGEYQKVNQEETEDKTDKSHRINRDSNKINELYGYATSNKEQTITYILLIIGLFSLLFFNYMLGGLIIGMVAGYYFASEIVYAIRNISHILGDQNQLRSIVLAGLLLGLFIAAPGIFIGAAIVTAFKQVMFGNR